jgi:hypothetical protein
MHNNDSNQTSYILISIPLEAKLGALKRSEQM